MQDLYALQDIKDTQNTENTENSPFQIIINSINMVDDEVTMLLDNIIRNKSDGIRKIAEIDSKCLKRHEKAILNHDYWIYPRYKSPFLAMDYRQYIMN